MQPARSNTGIFNYPKQLLPALFAALLLCSSLFGAYKPADGPLMTRWAKNVSPTNAHPEYPRPQMVRGNWLNLNGLWEYAIRPKDQPDPMKADGQILVPFCAESALSGVMKPVGEDNRLWYRRTFEIPEKWSDKRILLHFEGVDWDATVWVNDKKVGSHRGGYDPFTFDITDVVGRGEQEIVVSVWDPTNTGSQPRGKQVKRPGGIMYTAVTGIWATVWLEAVDAAHIRALNIVPDIDAGLVRVTAECSDAAEGCIVEAEVKDGWWTKAKGRAGPGRKIDLPVENARLWSPDKPFLYDLNVTLRDKDGGKVDAVKSYFGMRKSSLGRDASGITRLFLNNEPLFQYGPLDQGWWPDGLYTAPTDEALKYDIEILKRLGCNMMRKHVKVEPRRFYYWCDKLGILVWQDMASGNNRGREAREQFELELTRVIESRRNSPAIIMWVPFNEGWGQYDTERIVDLVRKTDPTRLVNNASGWTDRGVGDVHDIHRYPGPGAPPNERNRAAVLGEFGGLGLPIKGHTWQAEKNWGYRSYKSREELTDAYVTLIENLRSLIGGGLCAAVYTQTTDVEVEVNGMLPYDRSMVKMDIARMTAANKSLYLPPPIVKTIVPTSQEAGRRWRYTSENPGAGWEKPGFDDSGWKEGAGGFGTEGTPGTVVRTQWRTGDIWIRRTFELGEGQSENAYLLIHHDEDAEVFINGVEAAGFEGYTISYVYRSLDPKGRAALKAGGNCLAVHCRQTSGGQYIDVGLVEVIER
ncbi:MAG: hypothetical protein JSU94_03225 [Phycisphaerales bacterium]|nr:MAG: hypothetical protein JSU94_03225 [Phycisphaerales bacterium]